MIRDLKFHYYIIYILWYYIIYIVLFTFTFDYGCVSLSIAINRQWSLSHWWLIDEWKSGGGIRSRWALSSRERGLAVCWCLPQRHPLRHWGAQCSHSAPQIDGLDLWAPTFDSWQGVVGHTGTCSECTHHWSCKAFRSATSRSCRELVSRTWIVKQLTFNVGNRKPETFQSYRQFVWVTNYRIVSFPRCSFPIAALCHYESTVDPFGCVLPEQGCSTVGLFDRNILGNIVAENKKNF